MHMHGDIGVSKFKMGDCRVIMGESCIPASDASGGERAGVRRRSRGGGERIW